MKIRNRYNRIFIVLPVVLIMTVGCRAKGISAEEWIISRGESLNLISMYEEGLEETVALYAAGAIRTDDFASEMDVRAQEYGILRKQFDQELGENPVRAGTHTYLTKCGYDAFIALWNDIEELTILLKELADEGASSDEAVYQYLAYMPGLEDDMARFMAAFYLVSETGIPGETENDNGIQGG